MATPTLRFSKKNIEAIEPPAKGRNTYRDDVSRHLHLRVTAKGAKSFVLIRKIKGRVRYITLGAFPEVPPQQARRLAEERSAELLRGEEPNAPKTDKLTFGELFTRYMDGYAKPHKKTWKEDQRKHDKLFPGWDPKRVDSITREQVTRLHAKLGKERGPYLANRTLALLSVVFSYGRDTLRLNIENPCRGVKKFKEQSRERFLDTDELRRFFEALNSEQTPEQWRDFFALCLWTGARRNNVQSMKWEHIDLRAGLWEIPGEEFKNGDQFKVVLTDPAVEILTRRKLDSDGKTPYVFPADSATGHIVEPRKAWARILERAELKNLTIHDLRRTLGSHMAASGASLQVIGRTLGHKDTATTAIYSRLNLDPVRASLNTATSAMCEAINAERTNDE